MLIVTGPRLFSVGVAHSGAEVIPAELVRDNTGVSGGSLADGVPGPDNVHQLNGGGGGVGGVG